MDIHKIVVNSRYSEHLIQWASQYSETFYNIFLRIRLKYSVTLLIKYWELTVVLQFWLFFQITFLHVYHHFVMPLFLWPSVRYVPGGNNVFASSINAIIHVFMYGYYFAAALGPLSKWALIWKKSLTTAQVSHIWNQGVLKIKFRDCVL